jgi:methylmalonyl-CoA mutase
MYAGRPWTIRQYAGFSTAEESNAFYRRNLAAGQKGLSVAFDWPPIAAMTATTPRGGRCRQGGRGHRQRRGHEDPVRRHSLGEMSVSMTMNGAVIPILAFFIVAGEEQGVRPKSWTGPFRMTF